MVTIGITNTKGGVGKTTTAIYLASAGIGKGLNVEVRDLDKQGSALEWVESMGEVKNLTAKNATAHTIGRPSTADLLIIDTGPADPMDIQTVAEIADFIIVPTPPGGLNDHRTLKTVDFLEKLGSSYAVVLTEVSPRSVSAKETRNIMADKVAMFDTEIPHRQEIVRAGNKGLPQNLFGYEKLLDDVLEAIK